MAASTAPAAKTLHLSLFTYLFKHKVWLAGIGMVLLASVCQAVALATGPVALVQPIFIIELPFTLLVASRLARRKLPRTTWIAVAVVTVALGLGLSAACGYALTATLLKSAVAALDQGVGAFFSTWELYGTAIAGVGALFMLQNALQAGSLIAVQPPLTLGDALISACYGVTVFGEDVQTGGWLLAVEIVAVLAIAAGCIELSRS